MAYCGAVRARAHSVQTAPGQWYYYPGFIDGAAVEEEMATHSSILAWRTPRTEEPGGLQPMGSQRVRHD